MVEEAVELGAGAGVGDHALSGTEDVCFFLEAILFGGLEQAFVW